MRDGRKVSKERAKLVCMGSKPNELGLEGKLKGRCELPKSREARDEVRTAKEGLIMNNPTLQKDGYRDLFSRCRENVRR